MQILAQLSGVCPQTGFGQANLSAMHAWSKLLSHASITHRMKSWLKSSNLPAVFLSVLALGTLGMCFLLATHRHTGILRKLIQAKHFSITAFRSGAAHQSDTVRPGPQHTVTLKWNASTTAGVRYNVYRRGISGTAKVNPSPLTETICVDSAVQPGQTYYYVAKAVNANGTESVASNEVRVTIPSP